MTKWFKKVLWRWCSEGRVLADTDSNKESNLVPIGSAIQKVHRSRCIDQHGLNFTVYSAQGGTIIEMRAYNEKTDNHDHKLYVVRDDQELGKELDHIITLEALRR